MTLRVFSPLIPISSDNLSKDFPKAVVSPTNSHYMSELTSTNTFGSEAHVTELALIK